MIPVNQVLIQPDENNSDFLGFNLVQGADELSVTGTVLETPKQLLCSKSVGGRTQWQIHRNQIKNQWCLDFDTTIEIKPGDRVMFQHRNHFLENPDGGLLCGYDSLFARIDSENLYPLNGGVLIEVSEVLEGDIKSYPSTGEGIIRYVGSRNRGYKFSRMSDLFDPTPGQHCLFNPKQGIAIEQPHHAKHGKLIIVRRKDLLCVWN